MNFRLNGYSLKQIYQKKKLWIPLKIDTKCYSSVSEKCKEYLVFIHTNPN